MTKKNNGKAQNFYTLPGMEKDGTPFELDLPNELSVRAQENAKAWTVHCSWAGQVDCILRERSVGTIEAEGPHWEKEKPRTGTKSRAEAIWWARLELEQAYDRAKDAAADEVGEVRPGRAGRTTIRDAIKLIRKHKLHLTGKKQKPCSASQVAKYEMIMDCVLALWPTDLPADEIDSTHITTFHNARMGRHLDWVADKKGRPILDNGKRVLLEDGKGKALTPYAVIFPAEFNRAPLAPAHRENTVTSNLKDLKTLFYRLMKVGNGKYMSRNPLENHDLGSFTKKKTQPTTIARYKARMHVAEEVVQIFAAKYPHHTYVPGMLRCILAILFHTGHRVTAVLSLRISDLLFDSLAMRERIAMLNTENESDSPLVEWADAWPHGGIYWDMTFDKENFDRVIPINVVLRAELARYLELRLAAGIDNPYLFPRPIDPTTEMLDYDLRDLIYAAEELASQSMSKHEARATFPPIDKIAHGDRGLWENLRDTLGWFMNKNSAYAGGWTTNIGGVQQTNYNKLKAHYIQAVVDGRSIFEVIRDSEETRDAQAAIQTMIPFKEDTDRVSEAA
jgi:integrase